MLEHLPPTPRKNLRDTYPHASEEAIDFMTQTLQFNPIKRPTAEQVRNFVFFKAQLLQGFGTSVRCSVS